jgi:hypothetical protein
MCARYFKADELLAAVRVEHQAFYRRIFQHRMVCAPRPYPLLAKPISLMTIDYPAVAEDVHRRYPFFRSTLFERRMLFERAPAVSRSDKLRQDLNQDLKQDLNRTRHHDQRRSQDRPLPDPLAPFAELEIACGA